MIQRNIPVLQYYTWTQIKFRIIVYCVKIENILPQPLRVFFSYILIYDTSTEQLFAQCRVVCSMLRSRLRNTDNILVIFLLRLKSYHRIKTRPFALCFQQQFHTAVRDFLSDRTSRQDTDFIPIVVVSRLIQAVLYLFD